MIKQLQTRLINKFQPRGIQPFCFIPFNVHDELQCSHLPEDTEALKQEVKDFQDEYQETLPMFVMEWKKLRKNWAESH